VSIVLPHFVSTELTAGIQETRAIPHSTPEQVAEAVVDALRFNRFEVWVPARVRPTWLLANVLPLRVRDALGRALNIDRSLMNPDRAARAAYEARAAASAPAAEAVIVESAADDARESRAA
jgi:hypothetical protein